MMAPPLNLGDPLQHQRPQTSLRVYRVLSLLDAEVQHHEREGVGYMASLYTTLGTLGIDRSGQGRSSSPPL